MKASSTRWPPNSKLIAYGTRDGIFDFPVAGYRSAPAVCRISIDGMLAALAVEHAAVIQQVTH
jgi:hypothetical protein